MTGSFEECLTFRVEFDTIYLQAFTGSNQIYCVCETGATPKPSRCGTGEDANYYTM